MKRAAAAGDPFPLVLLDAFMPEMDGFAVAEQIKRDPDLAGATIMMLSSADRSRRCLPLPGTGRRLLPPQADRAVGTVRRHPDRHRCRTSGTAGVLPYSGVPATGRGERSLHILLAEDNEVNQQLAVKTLQKRGHTVVVAGNGREALAALEQETVDLVLMDVQMPEMDGFAATAAIREREKGTGRHIPIVALTAHAMKGDRERCLAAGMDAYVSKPLRVEELFDAIARFFPTAGDAETIPMSNGFQEPTGNQSTRCST